MKAGREFFNLYNHDLIRLAVATPAVRVANPAFNGEQTLALIREAAERKAAVVLFPELGLSAYSCDDLFQQRVVLDGCRAALERDCRGEPPARRSSRVVGLRSSWEPSLFNCAAVSIAGAFSAWCPRPICPTIANFTRCASSSPATWRYADHIDLCGQHGFRSAARLLFAMRGTAAASRFTSRFAKTCGCRFRRLRTQRWQARRCC